MRIALTRLRTTIDFFSPMVTSLQQLRLADELKWLNAHLGAVRDLDVAIERLTEIKPRLQVDYRSWNRERAETQRHLTRALRSLRYRRLIKSISYWIEKGSWSTKRGKQAASQRACPVAEYSARKLMRWRKKLIKRSRKLREIGTRKRHRLRLLNKRLSYAIESVADLASESEISRLAGDAEGSAQGAEISRAVERRCKVPVARGHSGTRRRRGIPNRFSAPSAKNA